MPSHKRPLAHSPLSKGHELPFKRSRRSTTSATSTSASHVSFEKLLSDEVILRIFHYLDARDLVRLHQVCGHLNRLSGDPQLWKALFLNDYIRAPTGLSVSSRNYDLPNIQTLGSVLLHQGTNSAVSSGRKIAGLPKRYYQPHLRSNVALGLTGHRTAEPRSESSLRESKSTDGPSVVLSQDDIAALEGLDVRHDGLDWKALYRVSHNWQQGSFIVNRLFDGIFAKRSGKAVRERVWTQQLDRDENSEERREQPSTSSHHPGPVRPMTLVQASPYLIFTASRATNYPQAQPFAAEALPSARVYMADEPSAPHAPHDPTSHEPLCALHSSRLADALSRDAAAQIVARNGIAITEIRINAAPLSPMTASSSKGKGKAGSDVDLPGVMRFLVCYSTGHFVIFRVSLHEDSFVRYVEEYVHDPFAPSQARPHAAESSSTSTDKPPVTVLSAFHSPLLVTCTADFAISIYRIDAPGSASLGEEGSKTKVEFLRELRSFTCHWPACLNLRKLPIIDVDMQRKNGRRRSSSASLGGMSDQSLVRSRSTERRLTRWPAQSILHPEANSTATGSSSTASIAAEAEAECAFRLSIAYSTPMYPASWTIGLQEIVLRLPLSSFSSSSSSTTRPRMIITSRHATAVPTFARTPLDTRGSNIFRPPRPSVEQPLPWRDPRSRMAEVFETSPASRGGTRGKARDRTREGENRVTSVTYDEPFVVVGAQDNLLEVYELFNATTHVPSRPPTSSARSATATPTTSSSVLRLEHRRVLYGHTGSVQSVALEDGRCVSGSADGSVMVWTLAGREKVPDRNDGARFPPNEDATTAEVLDDDQHEERQGSALISHVVTLRSPARLSSVRTTPPSQSPIQVPGGSSPPKGNLSESQSQSLDSALALSGPSASTVSVSRPQRSRQQSWETQTPTSKMRKVVPSLGDLLRHARSEASESDVGGDADAYVDAQQRGFRRCLGLGRGLGLGSGKPPVIRWVSTGFDKIVSVSSTPSWTASTSDSEEEEEQEEGQEDTEARNPSEGATYADMETDKNAREGGSTHKGKGKGKGKGKAEGSDTSEHRTARTGRSQVQSISGLGNRASTGPSAGVGLEDDVDVDFGAQRRSGWVREREQVQVWSFAR